jgi:prepilin-type processing-associated H-X9-DG protein
LTLVESVVVIAILALLLGLLIGGVQVARQAAARNECSNHLRQVGMSLHSYHDRFNQLPPGIVSPRLPPSAPQVFGKSADPYPLMTWQMRILPFIEQGVLWKAITDAYAKDPYLIANPPHWAKEVPIPLLLCPADGDRPPGNIGSGSVPALTSYLGVSGINAKRIDGVFYLDSRTRFRDITDGLGNTVAVGERPPSQDRIYGRWHGGWGPWGDVNTYLGVRELAIGVYGPRCPEGPYPFQHGRLDDLCSVFHYWSFHSGGANFLFADGSVRFLAYTSAPVLPALATRAGGEVVTLPD